MIELKSKNFCLNSSHFPTIAFDFPMPSECIICHRWFQAVTCHAECDEWQNYNNLCGECFGLGPAVAYYLVSETKENADKLERAKFLRAQARTQEAEERRAAIEKAKEQRIINGKVVEPKSQRRQQNPPSSTDDEGWRKKDNVEVW